MEPHSSSSSSSSPSPPFPSFFLQPTNPQARQWKKPVAPPPRNLPRVYNVDPINFRDVVQKLTASPEFQDRRLQAMPAPHPNLSNPPPSLGFSSGRSASYNGHSGFEFSERY